MKNSADVKGKKPFLPKHSLTLLVALLNIILFATAALSYGRYSSVYQERLREENLGNIANLNQSSALNTTALISSLSIKLEDIALFAGQHDMTPEEALVWMEQTNSSGDRQLELIGSDYTGFLARRDEEGGFIPLSYDHHSYAELKKAFDDINDEAYDDVCFTAEFTDGATALKYFAVYRHIPLIDETGAKTIYTLLLSMRSSAVLAAFNSQNGFEGQSTVLVEPGGNYILSNNDYKSTNFFQYLYLYNDLSLDERNDIEREMAENASGNLYYKDSSGEDCVFRYERMKTNSWYCVTSVPVASFRTPVFSTNYLIYAVVSLLLLLTLDIAWLQHMNHRLRASAQREMEASEAKTEFLSRMSHDIRTPLNGIIGLTSLAMDENTSPKMQEYLENIRVSGQFLFGLVNDILDLSKVESGKVELKPEPYSSRDLYKYVEAVVAPLCKEKGLSFLIDPPDPAPPVLLDRLRFNQIVFNLLSNAVKYTPEGGLVEFRWTRTDLPEGRVTLTFSVRDNGIGMSEEFQARMFESFSQEHAQTAETGTGLGLTIVSSLVRLMHGTIEVQSRRGEGSIFTVSLETSVCEVEDEAEEAYSDDVLTGKHILLCEDNLINVMVAQKILEKWGVSSDTAGNGRIGLEMFSAAAPGFYDAILMDIMMPEMNGLDAARLIRALDRPDAKTIPIIAMTANAYDTDVKNCLDAGMDAHTGKPIDQERFKEQLSSLISASEKRHG